MRGTHAPASKIMALRHLIWTRPVKRQFIKLSRKGQLVRRARFFLHIIAPYRDARRIYGLIPRRRPQLPRR